MHLRPRALLVALAAGALVAGPARALDALSLRLEPSYTNSDQRSTDQAGTTTQTYSSAFTSKLDLTLRQELLPLVQVYASGNYQRTLASTSQDGVRADSQQDQWRLYGRTQVGDRRLNATADVTETQQSLDSRSGGVTAVGPTMIQHSYGGSANWRPEDLPSFTLRVLRNDQHDRDRVLADSTSTIATGTLMYDLQKAHIYYTLGYTNPVDHLRGIETTSVEQGVTLSVADTFLDDRVRASLDYQMGQATRWLRVLSSGATVVNRVFTVQGLSAVETFPSLPTRIALSPNAALIDGDPATSAGLDIGFGPSLAGDANPRDVGVQLPDLISRVNEISVFVDRQLPPAVSSALSWTVYRSDNNLDWAPLGQAGSVRFDLLQNRFVIPVNGVTARYLKAVVRPLSAAVTTDSRYQAILIAEVQIANVVDAASQTSRASSIQGTVNTGLRVDILRETTRLVYDFQGLLAHRNNPRGLVTGTATSGLTLDRPLGPIFSLSARGERSDGNTGAGHEASTRYTARLGAQPLPTLGGSATYAGQAATTREGTALSNAFMLFGRAEPYRFVSLSTSLSLALGSAPAGQATRATTGQVSASIVPNPAVTLTLSYAYSDIRATTPDGSSGLATERIEGAVTVAPFPALFATASAARTRTLGRWYTLLNFSGNFAPFPSGDLILSANYSDTLDTSADSRTRSVGPYARWTISRGGAFVETSFGWIEVSSPALGSRSRAFGTRLVVPL